MQNFTQCGPIFTGQWWQHRTTNRMYYVQYITPAKLVCLAVSEKKMVAFRYVPLAEFLNQYTLIRPISLRGFVQTDGTYRIQITDPGTKLTFAELRPAKLPTGVRLCR